MTNQVLDGKYRIDARLGQGGMGAVFRATQLVTLRTVAVKVIAPDLAGHPEFEERFRQEARAAGRLRHPNIVLVTDFGSTTVGASRVTYLVMEYLDGMSLADFLRKSRQPNLGLTVEIVEQICAAVDEAHARGVVHRDLKPANIWLVPTGTGGYLVKVLDFGLAKLGDTGMSTGDPVTVKPTETPDLPTGASDASEYDTLPIPPASAERDASSRTLDFVVGLTRPGAILGTPVYMSPEQCRGGRIDMRADIYSIGVIAFEMLAGVVPFQGDSKSLREQHVAKAPTPPSIYNPSVSLGMDAVVLSALAKEPDNRPASAGALSRTLRATVTTRGALIGQALRLLGQFPGVCFRLSLFGGYLPIATVGALTVAAIARDLGSGTAVSTSMVIGSLALLICLVYSGLSTGTVFVPVVAQLLDASDRAVRVRDAVSVLIASDVRTVLPHPAWACFPVIVLTTEILCGNSVVTLVVGLAAFLSLLLWTHGFGDSVRVSRLLGPVVAVERLSRKAAIERAAQLSSRLTRAHGTAYGYGLFAVIAYGLTVVVLVLFPSYVYTGLVDPLVRARLGVGWLLIGSAGFVLLIAIALAANALTGICFALAYLNALELGGETVAEAVVPIRNELEAQGRVTPPVRSLRLVLWGLFLSMFAPPFWNLELPVTFAGSCVLVFGLNRLRRSGRGLRAAYVTGLVLLGLTSYGLVQFASDSRGDVLTADLHTVLPSKVDREPFVRSTDRAEEIGPKWTMMPLSASNRIRGEYANGTVVVVLRYSTKSEALKAFDSILAVDYGIESAGLAVDGLARSRTGVQGGGVDFVERRTDFERTVTGVVPSSDGQGYRYFGLSWKSTESFSNPFRWTSPADFGDGVLIAVNSHREEATRYFPLTLQLSPSRSEQNWLLFQLRELVSLVAYALTVLLVCSGLAQVVGEARNPGIIRTSRWCTFAFALVAPAYLASRGAPSFTNVDTSPMQLLIALGLMVTTLAWVAVNIAVLAVLRAASSSDSSWSWRQPLFASIHGRRAAALSVLALIGAMIPEVLWIYASSKARFGHEEQVVLFLEHFPEVMRNPFGILLGGAASSLAAFAISTRGVRSGPLLLRVASFATLIVSFALFVLYVTQLM